MTSSVDRHKVAVLVGSLRTESLTRKLAQALIELAPGHLACEMVEVGDLPLYNEDLEAEAPPSWTRFRDAGVQPLDPEPPQERDRRRFATLWPGASSTAEQVQ